jgi:VWFA-related protein
MPRSLSPVLLSLLMAMPASAQVRESVTVEVIEVPVYVSTSSGTPLRGLTREAFQLFVNGKQQPIEYFDPVDDTAAPAPDATTRRDPRERRLYILLFDLFFNRDIVRLQRAADELVTRSNPAVDYFSVATFSASRGFQFAIPFLNDRAAIHRAIATLAPAKANDSLGIATLADERPSPVTERSIADTDNISQVAATGGKLAGEQLSMLRGGRANLESLVAPRQRVAEDQLDSLREVAVRLRALDGQKHLVMMSTGYGGLFGGVDGQARYSRRLSEIYRAFRDGGAFIDTIDTLPMTSLNGGESLRQLADATGGISVRGNDLTQSLTQLVTQHAVAYRLGFRRRDAKGGTIEVRVHDLPRNTKVSYRKGFGEVPKTTKIDALQLADILISDTPQNGVTVSLQPSAHEVVITVPRAEVIAQIVPSARYVDALLYVFDAHGATALFKAVRIRIGSNERDSVITLRVPANLGPGKYTAKALLQIGGTQSLGFARADFEVGE